MTVPAERPARAADMNVAAYLERIGYQGPLNPNAETLRALHVAHLYTVPFENLDIGLGRPLSLELPALFDKIVTGRRGGFCYELNGLFAWLLQSLGYGVTHLSARTKSPDGSFGPEFDHLALRVVCPQAGGDPVQPWLSDEPWLADVGFGDSFVEPLRLEAGRDQSQGRRTFWLEERDGAYVYWKRQPGAAPERQYTFTLQP